VQLDIDVHDTLDSELPSGGFGTAAAWTDQLLPLDSSASGCAWPEVDESLPTDVHVAEDVHETSSKAGALAPVGVGVVSSDQLFPSQDSAKPGPLGHWVPTALQLVELVHETPLRTASVPTVGTGVDSIDQLWPSHTSANGSSVPELSTEYPTLAQELELTHEIAPNVADCAADGLETVWIDQLLPFQASATGRSWLELS
jgi:hypothetical protein